ncbi:DGQHR domain-containing protein [Photobacterium damselae]|uniref:DGQHR domain-containing protein n=1 Tax=Photobacterium damselae TaxID=38293 RepID=UPI001F166066|nr:DGQHR domain-containing protein [Photobacterium damselae]UKA09717.1 DGQHR domain-containing protein [Photobacterium damselae subsp. damselae]
MKEKIDLNAIKVTQPIGDFYIGVMNAEDLVSISFTDVRKMTREVEDYLGIQRELKTRRVNEIKEYISSLDATFPNSIIVAIKGKYVAYKNGRMTISFDDFERARVAKVLDGQHRLAGFDESNKNFIDVDGNVKPFQLVVTIFVERDISIQAKVFAMVNQNQTKVNPSLVYDLESLSTSRSPDKTAHQIAVLLNKNNSSPFYRRIKRLGVKTIDADNKEVKNELLTQAAFVSNLVKLISPKPKDDRNLLLGKKKGFLGFKEKSFSYTSPAYMKRCIFRQNFIDKNDEIIAINVSNYFEAISEVWEKEWDNKNKPSVLNKTVGFIAMMRLLRNIVNTVRDVLGVGSDYIIRKEQFLFILDSANISGELFYSVDAVSKSSGQIYKILDSNILASYRSADGDLMVDKIKSELLKRE